MISRRGKSTASIHNIGRQEDKQRDLAAGVEAAREEQAAHKGQVAKNGHARVGFLIALAGPSAENDRAAVLDANKRRQVFFENTDIEVGGCASNTGSWLAGNDVRAARRLQRNKPGQIGIEVLNHAFRDVYFNVIHAVNARGKTHADLIQTGNGGELLIAAARSTGCARQGGRHAELASDCEIHLVIVHGGDVGSIDHIDHALRFQCAQRDGYRRARSRDPINGGGSFAKVGISRIAASDGFGAWLEGRAEFILIFSKTASHAVVRAEVREVRQVGDVDFVAEFMSAVFHHLDKFDFHGYLLLWNIEGFDPCHDVFQLIGIFILDEQGVEVGDFHHAHAGFRRLSGTGGLLLVGAARTACGCLVLTAAPFACNPACRARAAALAWGQSEF